MNTEEYQMLTRQVVEMVLESFEKAEKIKRIDRIRLLEADRPIPHEKAPPQVMDIAKIARQAQETHRFQTVPAEARKPLKWFVNRAVENWLANSI